MASSRVAGGAARSSSSSGILFQGDGQSQVVGNSQLSSSFGNSSNSTPGAGRSNLGPVSGDTSNTILNSVPTSGPSAGASSLVTDANSGHSGGPHFHRSASFNTESYMRLPASPMSFSSNNVSISGSSVIDGSSVMQQNSNQDLSPQKQGASSATSLPAPRVGQFSLSTGSRIPGSFIQDGNSIYQMQKKPRLEINQEDLMQQQLLQQLLQNPVQLQNNNPQLQAFIQQQRLRQQQQQQYLQSIPPVQRAHIFQQQLQQQQQLLLRQQLQQQAMQPMPSSIKRPYDNGVCSRRLMQYLYHQRQRPPDNTLAYWRKFVAEYYSPRVKKRWCLSLYENVGNHSLDVFPQATVDAWQCDICGSKSGRGFEATFEVLPRLNEIKFGSGVTDELLFLDMPRECRFSTGIMMLEYGKAVQESVFEQLRVVHEGQLRIVFTPDLKILSWEFCARRHEELLPRRLVASQVNQLLQVAQKCQNTISESGSDGVSQQDLQTNSNTVVTAGRQLARTLELHSLNDLGFSKRYVRCLQISEVVNSMKDLMDFCRDQKVGAIEGLKSYPRRSTAAKLQMQHMEQLASIQGLPTDRNTLNKLISLQNPGLNIQMSNNDQMVNRGALSGSVQDALALTNYQNLLTRQNSMNSTNSLQHEPSSSSLSNPNQNPFSPFQGPTQNSNSNSPGGNGIPIHRQSHPQQQTIHKPLQNSNGNVGRDGLTTAGSINVGGSAVGPTPRGSNNFKAASKSDLAAAGNSELNDLDLSDELLREFTESGFFSSDIDDWISGGGKDE